MMSAWQRPALLLDPYLAGADWCAIHIPRKSNVIPVNLQPDIDHSHVTAIEKSILAGM